VASNTQTLKESEGDEQERDIKKETERERSVNHRCGTLEADCFVTRCFHPNRDFNVKHWNITLDVIRSGGKRCKIEK